MATTDLRVGGLGITVDSTGTVTVEGTGGAPGQIDLSDGTNAVQLRAPTGLAGNVDFTLPSTAGTTDQFLQRTGAASLGWTTNLGISDSSLPLSVKMTNRNGAPSQTQTTTFAVRGNVTYDGTTTDNTITKIQAIVETTNDVATGQVRIFDFTNSNIIATSAIFGPTVGGFPKTTIDLGAISNLPTGQALLEIQLRRDNVAGGGNAQLHICQFYA
ncbi:MAG: hypothetical protein KUG81_02190 [Gammaproteobacteria bacterium]|nr:hypothetical protein [Gammaproteobacteria bacterium]